MAGFLPTSRRSYEPLNRPGGHLEKDDPQRKLVNDSQSMSSCCFVYGVVFCQGVGTVVVKWPVSCAECSTPCVSVNRTWRCSLLKRRCRLWLSERRKNVTRRPASANLAFGWSRGRVVMCRNVTLFH